MSGPKQQTPTPPAAPPAPANPPMFGENMRKQKPSQSASMKFDASILGSLPTNSAQGGLMGGIMNTMKKSMLG